MKTIFQYHDPKKYKAKIAGKIEISNHSIDNLFELEAFIKTHSIRSI